MAILLLYFYFVSAVFADDFSVWQTERFALYPQLPVAFPWSISEECRRDSLLILSHLENQTLWAVKMVDSSARSPTGILQGNMFQMGSLDECLTVKSPILSQMCTVKITADLSLMNFSPSDDPYLLDPPPMENAWVKIRDSRIDQSKWPRDRMKAALCVPRSCKRKEVERAINVYLNHSNGDRRDRNLSTFSAEVADDCITDEEEPFTMSEISFWGFSGLLVILAVVSTIFHRGSDNQSSKCYQLLLAFSLKKNWKSFISREGEAKALDILHGVKLFTICSIIMSHRMAIFLASVVFNYQGVEEKLRDYIRFLVPNYDLLVDSFFHTAGLLSAYLILGVFSKQFINPLLLIFSRFIRIMPLYLFLIWFHASALLRLGSGIFWKVLLEDEASFCQRNWWTNVVFLNNYIHPEKMCMLQTWFLACDFHFFVASIFLVILLLKSPRVGKVVLYVLLIIFTIVPGVIVYINDIPPNILFYNELVANPRAHETFLQIYTKSHARAATYIIGILTGHFLFVHENTPKKLGTRLSVLAVSFGLIFLFTPMAYGSLYYIPNRPHDLIENSIFATLRRFMWAIGSTILMLAYRFGQIPLVGPMLTSRPIIALSKLSYGAYLVHFIMQVADYSKAKVPSQFIPIELVHRGINDIVCSLLIALVLWLLIEQPTRSIFKILIFSKEGVQKKFTAPPTLFLEPMKHPDGPITNSDAVYTVKL